MDAWAWAAIAAGVILLLVGIGYLADWGIRQRVKAEVGNRMRERADTLRQQAETVGWGEGHDRKPGGDPCENCGGE